MFMKCLSCKSEVKEFTFLGKNIKYDDNFCRKCFKKSDPIIKKIKPIKIELCFSCLSQKDKKGFVENNSVRKLYKKMNKIEKIKKASSDDIKIYKNCKDKINDIFTSELEAKMMDQIELSNDYEIFDYEYEIEPIDVFENKKNNKIASFNFYFKVKAMKHDLFKKFAAAVNFKFNKKKYNPLDMFKLVDKKNKKIIEKYIEEEEIEGNMDILYSICQNCKKLYGNYYESILKLRYKIDKYRNINSKPSYDKIIKFAQRTTEKAGQRIVKQLPVENGVDYYFSDNQFLDFVIKKIENEFGIKCIRSYTLYTEDKQTNKRVYRHTASLKAPLLILGDYIEDLDENRILQFIEQKKEYVKFRDILKNINIKMDHYDDLNMVKLNIKERLSKMNIINIKSLEVFDEDYNEVVSVKNPYKKKIEFKDSPLNILYYNEEYYYIPLDDLDITKKVKK